MSETPAQNSPTRGVFYLYMAAAFVIVVAGMRAAEPILNPMLLAVFLAVISAPAYFGLLRRKVSNWLALLIVIGVLSAIMLSVVYVAMESIAGFTSRQQHYRELLAERTKGLKQKIEGWIPEWAREELPKQDRPDDSKDPDDTDPDDTDPDDTEPDDTEPVDIEPVETEPDDGDRDESFSPAATAAATALVEPPNSNDDTSAVPNDGTSASTDDADSAEAETRPAGAEPNHVAASEPRPRQDFGFPQPDRQLPADGQSWRDYMSEQFDPGTFISLVASVAGSIGQLLSNVFLILLTVIFILLEAGTFARKIRDAFDHSDEATARAQQIINSIQHYIVIKTWVSLATGIFIAIWLKVIGVPYAGLWGLLAFLFNFIPNIGSIIAAVPAVLIAWLELTTLPAIAAAVGFLIVNGAVGNFIEPRLMGRGLGLSPLVVFFSMVFWGWVLGPIGMLLSVPLTMAARIGLDGFDDTKWIATLLGNAETA